MRSRNEFIMIIYILYAIYFELKKSAEEDSIWPNKENYSIFFFFAAFFSSFNFIRFHYNHKSDFWWFVESHTQNREKRVSENVMLVDWLFGYSPFVHWIQAMCGVWHRCAAHWQSNRPSMPAQWIRIRLFWMAAW